MHSSPIHSKIPLLTADCALFMLAAMSEKQERPNSSKKTAAKQSAAQEQPKSQKSPVKKKSRSTAARKRRQSRVLIGALIVFCILLISFNLFLITKLLSGTKQAQLSDAGQSRAAAETIAAPKQYEEPRMEHEPRETAAESSPPAAHTASESEREQPPITREAPAQHAAQQTEQERQSAQTETLQTSADMPPQRPAESMPQSEQRLTEPQKPAAGSSVPSSAGTAATPSEKVPSAEPALHAKAVPRAKPEQPKKHVPYAGTLTFVFDDAGHNLAQLEHFLRLPFPCTIAVLPGLRYSSESARRIRMAGKQAILHQPMQSVDLRIDPGPGAIKPGFSAEQIKSIVRKNLEEIWPVAGMNNHEGSLITADESAMKAVLEVVAEKGIFFLDSRTTAKSVVAKVAKEQNMTVWERAIFIDNDKSRKAMEAQIQKGLGIAKRTGSAIMIGHVFTVELAELLTEMYPMLVEEGFSLSTIAQTAQRGSIR